MTEIVFCSLFLFVFFGLLYLFHQVAATVTVQPWTILIHTKIFGNVFLIKFKSGKDKKMRKIRQERDQD